MAGCYHGTHKLKVRPLKRADQYWNSHIPRSAGKPIYLWLPPTEQQPDATSAGETRPSVPPLKQMNVTDTNKTISQNILSVFICNRTTAIFKTKIHRLAL